MCRDSVNGRHNRVKLGTSVRVVAGLSSTPSRHLSTGVGYPPALVGWSHRLPPDRNELAAAVAPRHRDVVHLVAARVHVGDLLVGGALQQSVSSTLGS